MSSTNLIVTADGSHSLLNVNLNETYHSVHGAIQESRYVFIEQGLAHWCNAHTGPVTIFEVGFGTGLNALLSLEFSQNMQRSIQYTTLEAYPLGPEVYLQLNYGDKVIGREAFNNLHESPWETENNISELFTFRKLPILLEQFQPSPGSYDLIFFDAFAPSRQPEMWDKAMLAKVVSGLRPSGIFVTYCARGQVKRDLRDLGVLVETLPGPPGKKEMIRGVLQKDQD